MKKPSGKMIAVIVLVVVAAAAIASVFVYRNGKLNLLNRPEYKRLASGIEQAAADGSFTSQQSLQDFLTAWARGNDLEYTVDDYGNIIFTKQAADRKKKVSPTVICVNCNFETADSDACALASAAMIAKTDIESGRRTVIFFSNEKDMGEGYKNISSSYFTDNTKVIYVDSGNASYLSTHSYAQETSYIDVPVSREDASCDTAVKISITGLDSGFVSSGIDNRPDVIGELGYILNMLKTKSVTSQLSDFSVGGNGNMYPVSMHATILINSYSLSSFTSYLDKQIKEWNNMYGDKYSALSFTYEIIEDEEDIPDRAYSDDTFDKLANLLYTVKSGTYQFASGDSIPDGYEEGDNYGLNCMVNLTAGGKVIRLRLLSRACDNEYLNRIVIDSSAAAELCDCTFSEGDIENAFDGESEALAETIIKTYKKVKDIGGDSLRISSSGDSYFTPCSYLSQINENMKIIHIRENNENGAVLTNTLLCYIQTKGNFLSL